MSFLKYYRRGKYFIKVLGDEFANEEPLSVEQFYLAPAKSQGSHKMVVTVGLTTRHLYIALMSDDIKHAVKRTKLPLDLITWIDIDARSTDYPWVLDSLDFEGPMELSSVGHGARLPILLMQELTKLDRAVIIARTPRQKIYVEYFPWRPYTPGSWIVSRTSSEEDPEVGNVVNYIQTAYRNGSLRQGQCILDCEVQHVPSVLDEHTAAHAHCLAAGLPDAQAATVGMDDGGNPCLVAVNTRNVAVSQLYLESVTARGRPLTALSALSDVDARMGLYSFELNTMYLKFNGYPQTVRIECDSLGDEWRPLIAKAASAPGPGLPATEQKRLSKGSKPSKDGSTNHRTMSRLGLRRPRPADSEQL